MDIAQFNMVEQQIRPWNVHDSRLLKQISVLNRPIFVPQNKQALCWMDTMIALEDGSRMLMPKTAARLVQALELHEDDTVLMVGAGSGYTLALCAALSKNVDCVDTSQVALDRAKAHCDAAGISNINFQLLVSAESLKASVYDAVLLREECDCAPEAYFHCLNEGGRCVAQVGGEYVMELLRYRRQNGEIEVDSIVDILKDSEHVLSGLPEVKEAFVF